MKLYREGGELHPPIFDPPTAPLICNYLSHDDVLCGQPGKWHIIWNADLDNGVSCDEHLHYVKTFAYVGCHPMLPDCFMPGGVWRPDEDICVIDESGLDLPELEMANALVIDGSAAGQATVPDPSDFRHPQWVLDELNAQPENDGSRDGD